MENPDLKAVLEAASHRASENRLPYCGALTPKEAQVLLCALPGSKVIDVRTKAEWDYVGRVPGSTLLEWQHYPSMAHNPRFVEQLRELVPDQETPLIFLCRSGARSHSAAAAAAAAGYAHAFNLLEGFEGNKDAAGHRNTMGGWRAAGLPWVQT